MSVTWTIESLIWWGGGGWKRRERGWRRVRFDDAQSRGTIVITLFFERNKDTKEKAENIGLDGEKELI